MQILRTLSSARRFRDRAAAPVVLVPTMGALHRGHAALIRRARRAAGASGTVIVSIFVNPTQFGPKEDLDRYPRTFPADQALCRGAGADAIFHPAPQEIYPSDFSTWVNEDRVSLPLCGASRPGHFRGVCTVVLKLFQITQPTAAVFGRKDFQQCAVIQRMVRDLNLPVRMILADTVREPDGLALSSRNTYLSPEERAQAPVIREAFLAARSDFRAGETRASELKKRIVRHIAAVPQARIDYVELVHPQSLEPVRVVTRGTVVAGAVFFGTTRLIDNLEFR